MKTVAFRNLKHLVTPLALALLLNGSVSAQSPQEAEQIKHPDLYSRQVKAFSKEALADSQSESFFNEDTKAFLQKAKVIVADNLPAMLLTPRLIPAFEDSSERKILSEPQTELLLSALSEAKKLKDPQRFSNCEYKPGLRLSLYLSAKSPSDLYGIKAKKLADFLLCLNCDVWAVVVSDSEERLEQQSARITHFIDSRSDRKLLTQLYQELFK